MVTTDNTAYQALVLVWLWCGNSSSIVTEKVNRQNHNLITLYFLIFYEKVGFGAKFILAIIRSLLPGPTLNFKTIWVIVVCEHM